MTTLETTTLRDRMTGQVVTPGDTGYDEARAIYNGMIDRRPAVIARCRSVADVRTAASTSGDGPGWRSPSAAAGTTGPGSAPSRAGW